MNWGVVMFVGDTTRMDAGQEAGSAPLRAPLYPLAVDPREVTHVVCCRDDPWVSALCGFDIAEGALNLSGNACGRCQQVIDSCWAARGEQEQAGCCPTDGCACPSDEWIFNRVVRVIT